MAKPTTTTPNTATPTTPAKDDKKPANYEIQRSTRKAFIVSTPTHSLTVEVEDKEDFAIKRVPVGASYYFKIDGEFINLYDEPTTTETVMRVQANKSFAFAYAKVAWQLQNK